MKTTTTTTENTGTSWVVGPSWNPDLLPPICFSGHRTGVTMLDWLTAEEAAELAARLTDAARPVDLYSRGHDSFLAFKVPQ